MNTHRRSWMLRAGMVALTVAGGLVAVAAPAQAAPGDPPTVTITNLDNGNLQPGGHANLSYSITAANDGGINVTITTSLSPDLTIQRGENACPGGNCFYRITARAGQTVTDTITLTEVQNPTTVQPGQQRGGNVTIQANPDQGGTANKTQNITIQGAAAAPSPTLNSVTEVSGVVKDGTNGNPVAKATVALQDSQGHNYTTQTSSTGAFTFKGSANNPISPGVVAVGVQADGYTTLVKNSPALNVGQTYRFQTFGMAAAAPASAAPSVADTATAGPAADGGSPVAQPNTTNVAKTGNGGTGFSTILIALGAVLILLGVGAVVYILVRRRRDGDEDDADLAPNGRPVPGAGGRGYPNDPTMVARSGGYGGQPTMTTARDPLADAPTMLHNRPPLDEYADPYNAPADPYGPATDPYGAPAPAPAAPRPGYGDATQQYGGTRYGGAGGGSYDEPTRYGDRGGYEEPPARGGYRSGGNVYGEPEPTRYAEPSPYEEPSPPPSGGGYGAPRGGYEPRGGHRSTGEYQEPRDPYEGGHARHGSPAGGDSRRQLDWLDD